jgi:type I restriction enzyme S subunit
MGVVPQFLDGALVSNDFPLFDHDDSSLDTGFLVWLSRTRMFVELCKRASEGTTNRVRLKENRFLALELPLPPLLEQKRIAQRVEDVVTRIRDAAGFRLRSRAEADVLLSVGRRELLETFDPTVPLEGVCEAIIDNLHSNPRLSEEGVPCVRSPDVGWGTLNLQTAQRTDEVEYRRRTARGEPRADDIVLVREGGGTGKCALVLPEQRFSLGQRVMMLRPDRQVIAPRFLLHQLLSPFIQDDQIQPLSKGSASPHLNIGALRKFKLRLPPMPEQIRIARALDELQTRVEVLQGLQRQTQFELDAMLPAILDQAFRGEL